MDALFQEKLYSFLEDTGINFQIEINNHLVHVKSFYLSPEIFGTVPMFFLSTDVPDFRDRSFGVALPFPGR